MERMERMERKDGLQVVLGASGGTGRALVDELVRQGRRVRAVARGATSSDLPGRRASGCGRTCTTPRTRRGPWRAPRSCTTPRSRPYDGVGRQLRAA